MPTSIILRNHYRGTKNHITMRHFQHVMSQVLQACKSTRVSHRRRERPEVRHCHDSFPFPDDHPRTAYCFFDRQCNNADEITVLGVTIITSKSLPLFRGAEYTVVWSLRMQEVNMGLIDVALQMRLETCMFLKSIVYRPETSALGMNTVYTPHHHLGRMVMQSPRLAADQRQRQATHAQSAAVAFPTPASGAAKL